ncbi:DNA mismatch endonuclease Vsr [bacterium]|nr:DNA mismatch endonuclease Vsr [bacterium]
MDNLDKKTRSLNMSAIRSKGTKPEMSVRSILRDLKIRCRYNVNKLPGKPDILVTSTKLAIFINGCFWHQHKNCKYASIPKSNNSFWKNKLKKNQNRDSLVRRQLNKLGYRTMTIWECQLTSRNKVKLEMKVVRAI